MTNPMRIRATIDASGVVNVKVLMRHIMESGQRKDDQGKLVPAWYIETVQAKVGDDLVFEAMLGPAVSRDPFFNFKFKGKPGDILTLFWKDSKGESRTDSVKIST
ncbi:thiosulfate oxidation carrier complex protein SoxZ [Orrella marina]|uniref:Thiosulfate oxidation carrier complex protein SoxZ n=1 Tax=Orrella marina TaxID=2163011 RepID=A0A2R4XJC3_9BURK|nr:thiosulfate oxidation carrier complex protein SoxZ [Orrella marina]AWB33868.1 thiosulfate oxidation carrier complex protein SoxZ [Orrella marina]